MTTIYCEGNHITGIHMMGDHYEREDIKVMGTTEKYLQIKNQEARNYNEKGH